MKKTIIIDNWKDVQVGDMLFVKGCKDGFRVTHVRKGSSLIPFAVDDPFGDGTAYVQADRFDHAERTIDETEWPHPDDIEMHVYLGADGEKYLYMPSFDGDDVPWRKDDCWRTADEMTMDYPEALPLKELKLVPKEEES